MQTDKNLKEKKSKAGRKCQYEDLVKSRFEEIKEWIQKDGLTDKEIYTKLGITKNTFYKYKKNYKEFKDLLKNNRISKVEEIKSALFKRAIGYEYKETKTVTTQIELDEEVKQVLLQCGFDVEKIQNPKVIKKEEYTKFSPPDPASCMILLKHWDKQNEWTNDPQMLKLKKKEFELNKKLKEQEIF